MPELLSVADLFGDGIVLRDLMPRSDALAGVESFREEMGWAAPYVPRKNEPGYARALLRMIEGNGGARRIVYVGDSLSHDGAAIRGFQEAGPEEGVWGFLCGATSEKLERDVMHGRLYLGADWRSLSPFVARAQDEGLTFDEGTWVLFDLDHTVYAAKERDHEPLVKVHWEAVRDYLNGVVPPARLDLALAERLYREFDDGAYYSVTRDNLDYLAFLILSVASGLTEAAEIRSYARSGGVGVGELAEKLRPRGRARVEEEGMVAVLDAVEAMCSSVLAGDPTPYKDLRRHECLAIARRMRGSAAGDEEGIYLNREAVSLISSVRRTPARLLAVSDRPPHAAVARDDEGGGSIDLMEIPMAIRGSSLPDLDLRCS